MRALEIIETLTDLRAGAAGDDVGNGWRNPRKSANSRLARQENYDTDSVHVRPGIVAWWNVGFSRVPCRIRKNRFINTLWLDY